MPSAASSSRDRLLSPSTRGAGLRRGRSRSISPLPPQPSIPHHELNNASGDYAIDSADPIIGDILYRLDDNREDRLEISHDGVVGGSASGAVDAGEAEERTAAPEAGCAPVDSHLALLEGKKWWQRPSQWWLIPMSLLLAIATGAIMSAKIELFAQVLCEKMFTQHKGEKGSLHLTLLRLPHEQPPMRRECQTNPDILADVVAESAQLQMKIAITVGLLSVMTTGWWGGLSDRRGRTKILACVVLSFLAFDFTYLSLDVLPITSVPFGTSFLLLPAVLNGALGGLATLIAAHQAYISDCTPAGTRVKAYARLTGFFYFGLIIGPAVGGWMVKATDSLVTPFLFATVAHFLYFCIALFIMPESTSKERRKAAMVENQEATSLSQEEEDERVIVKAKSKSLWLRFTAPLRPLAILLPRKVEGVERLHSRPADRMPSINDVRRSSVPNPQSSLMSVSHISRSRKRDWNLFFLSMAYAFEISCIGLLTVKSLYAQEVFNWGASELGYFFTFISITRALCLIVIIPIVIKFWHRPPKAVSLPQDAGNDEVEPLLDDEGRPRNPSFASYGAIDHTHRHVESVAPLLASSPDRSGVTVLDPLDPQHADTLEELWTLRAKHLRLLHDSHFDLKVARVSLLINVFAYAMMSLFRGRTIFVAASAATSLGAGAGASMSSLALALLQKPSQAGKLFGAWSVASAIGSDVVGPFIFTWVFRTFVHTRPHVIFYAGGIFLAASFACLCCIRLRKPKSLFALPPRPMSRPASTIHNDRAEGSEAQTGSISPARRSTFLDEE